MQEIVNKLIKTKQTISTMESCTGGFIASSITNIEGSSEIIKFSAITYSNEYKIKMGIQKETIDKYTVYSQEVANEMSKTISNYTNSDYGIGITGKLNSPDPNNQSGLDNLVYISIYDKNKDTYHNDIVKCKNQSRIKNKEIVLNKIIEILKNIL